MLSKTHRNTNAYQHRLRAFVFFFFTPGYEPTGSSEIKRTVNIFINILHIIQSPMPVLQTLIQPSARGEGKGAETWPFIKCMNQFTHSDRQPKGLLQQVVKVLCLKSAASASSIDVSHFRGQNYCDGLINLKFLPNSVESLVIKYD